MRNYLLSKIRGCGISMRFLNNSYITNFFIAIHLGLISRSLISIIFIYGLFLFILKFKNWIIFISILTISFFYSSNFSSTLKQESTLLPGKEISDTFTIVETAKIGEFYQTAIARSDNFKSFIQIETEKYPLLLAGTKLKSDLKLIKIDDKYENSDYSSYLKSRNIMFYAKANVISIKESSSLTLITSRLNKKISQIISSHTTYPSSALISGVSTGDTSKFSKELKEVFKNTGTSHIISVSGFNVLLIYSFLLSFAGIVSRKKLILLSSLFIVLYLLIVGTTNIPALRASITILFLVIASLTGRKSSIFNIILISSGLLLLENPNAYLNVSYQLTMSATVGLIFLSTKIKHLFPKRLVNEDIISTSSAFLSTFPFIFLNFQEVNYLGLISNVFVLPFVPILTILSIIASILALVKDNPISQFLFFVCDQIASIIIYILGLFNSLDLTINNKFLFIFTALISIGLLIIADYKSYKYENK